MAEAEASDEPKEDLRLAFLESWVLLKLGNSKDARHNPFKKLVATDGGASIQHFLTNPDCRRLFIHGKDKENKELLCGDLPPTPLKKRAIYFVKLERQALTADNISSLVVPGDLLPESLTQLHTLMEAAYLPLVSHGESQVPAGVVSELVDGLTRLSALIYVTLGQTQGRTLLPLPPETSAEQRRASETQLARDKERVHGFESAVVTWTRQIKATLKGDPEADTNKNGIITSHPGPMHELNFWTARADNLLSIQRQLKSAKIHRVVRVLELTHSTYCAAFGRIEADVYVAAEEARDTVTFLSVLKDDLELLETVDTDTSIPCRLGHAARPWPCQSPVA